MLSVVIRIIVLHSSEKTRKDSFCFIVCVGEGVRGEKRLGGKGYRLGPGLGPGTPGSCP